MDSALASLNAPSVCSTLTQLWLLPQTIKAAGDTLTVCWKGFIRLARSSASLRPRQSARSSGQLSRPQPQHRSAAAESRAEHERARSPRPQPGQRHTVRSASSKKKKKVRSKRGRSILTLQPEEEQEEEEEDGRLHHRGREHGCDSDG